MTTRRPELDGLRGVAIVGVVGIHALAYTGLDAESHPDLSFLVSTIAVPVFFLVDGLLLGLRPRAGPLDGYRASLVQSARRLLWPWLLFGVGYIALRGAIEALGLVQEHLVLGSSWASLRDDFLYSRIATQMYFLPALFVLRAIAPLWLAITRTGRGAPLLLAVGMAVGLNAGGLSLYAERFGEPSGYDIGVHALWGLQFQLVGLALAAWLDRLRALGRPALAIATLACAGTAWIAHAHGSETYAIAQYAYLAALCLPFVAGGLRARPMEALGLDSMGLYLLHTPILMSLIHRAIALAIPGGVLHFVLLTCADLAATWILVRALGRLPVARLVLFGEKPRRTEGLRL